MKEALSIQELKALCEFFFTKGVRYQEHGHHPSVENLAIGFEDLFDNLMAGKYAKVIEEDTFKIQFREMEAQIEKKMEQWDREKIIRAHQAMEDLRKFVITC